MKKTLIYLFLSICSLSSFAASSSAPSSLGDYLYTDEGEPYTGTKTNNTREWYTLYCVKTNAELSSYISYVPFGNGDGWSDLIAYVKSMSATQLASYSNDDDNDGLSDVAEIYYFSSPNGSSGINDIPKTYDTDGDGYSDYLEYTKGTNPYNASSYPANTDKDIESDVDLELDVSIGGSTTENTSQADELFSSYEKEAVSADGTAVNDLYATLLGDDVDISKMTDNEIIDSLIKSDLDGDGLSDYEEIAIGSNPLTSNKLDDDYATYDEDGGLIELKDTDGDGVSDYVEEKLGTSIFSDLDSPDTVNILDKDYSYKDSTAGSTSTGFVSVSLSDGNGNYITGTNTTTMSGELVSDVVDNVKKLADEADEQLESIKDSMIDPDSTDSSFFPDYYSSYIKAIIEYLINVIYPMLVSIVDTLVSGFQELSSYLKSILDLFEEESATYEFPYDTFLERYNELQTTFFDRFGIDNFNEYMSEFTMNEVEGTILFTAPLPSVSYDGFSLEETVFEVDFSAVINFIGSPVMRNFLVYILAFSYFFAYIRLFARW